MTRRFRLFLPPSISIGSLPEQEIPSEHTGELLGNGPLVSYEDYTFEDSGALQPASQEWSPVVRAVRYSLVESPYFPANLLQKHHWSSELQNREQIESLAGFNNHFPLCVEVNDTMSAEHVNPTALELHVGTEPTEELLQHTLSLYWNSLFDGLFGANNRDSLVNENDFGASILASHPMHHHLEIQQGSASLHASLPNERDIKSLGISNPALVDGVDTHSESTGPTSVHLASIASSVTIILPTTSQERMDSISTTLPTFDSQAALINGGFNRATHRASNGIKDNDAAASNRESDPFPLPHAPTESQLASMASSTSGHSARRQHQNPPTRRDFVLPLQSTLQPVRSALLPATNLSSCRINTRCAILAVVTQLHVVKHMSIDGASVPVTSVLVADHTVPFFPITLWRANTRWLDMLEVGDIVYINDVRISEFRRITSATALSHSSIRIVHRLCTDAPIDEDVDGHALALPIPQLQTLFEWAQEQPLMQYQSRYRRRPAEEDNSMDGR
ncbi:uncharacterized protein EV422DRAFT_315638 [Fimicolochytrium jonesii]|uniref:uncharacterized protein n=1 Tax=Fimicolochytrium jonesii TaxID=1396493 RepID=UPI0022FEEEA7|nr:uncharacterized protein EV422DRAFT_315638 [Fimicolochytrium jonesii]KAI8824299.1 hypothetical protein EV422DRAFT_315638 [Fimicolochytrium jonesii]